MTAPDVDLARAVDVVSSTLSSEDDVHDALHALRAGVAEIGRLREIERAALDVALAAVNDPSARRYLVPWHPLDGMRRKLEPIFRAALDAAAAGTTAEAREG